MGILRTSLPRHQTTSAETQMKLISSSLETSGHIGFLPSEAQTEPSPLALWAVSCSCPCNRDTAGTIKRSKGFSFALQKAIGI